MSEDTETFAFQAEINQLLSLIINVRLGLVSTPLDGVLSSIVPAAFFARFSNRRRLTRLATDDGPSRAFSTRADVLFEQGNFLARTHQVRDAR